MFRNEIGSASGNDEYIQDGKIMSLLTLASARSVWRGYEYYEANNIEAFKKISNTEMQGKLKGSNGKRYEVFIDIEHPRKSKCSCPHADGKRIICKHMIALCFSVFPEEAKKYYDEVIVRQIEEENRREEAEQKIINYIGKLKKIELQNLIFEILYDGPEWQYERFIHMYIE